MSGGVLDLLLSDSRTPSGGYAHSGGLEAAVADGLSSGSEVLAFMRARLATVGRMEAAFAASACGCSSLSGLLELDLELAARTPAEPLRRASRLLGRGLLRTASVWFPRFALLGGYREASALSPRPVALGVVAQAGGLPPLDAARASLYDDAATVAAAAVKLLPLDAAIASGWVLALGVEIDSLAEAVGSEPARFQAGMCLPSTATPLLDRGAMTHATTERRLFVS